MRHKGALHAPCPTSRKRWWCQPVNAPPALLTLRGCRFVRTYGLTEQQQDRVWAGLRAGESIRSIAHAQGAELQHVRRFFEQTGGARPTPRNRSAQHLTVVEREEVSRGLVAGQSARRIAARLGPFGGTSPTSRRTTGPGDRRPACSQPDRCCEPGSRQAWNRSGHRNRSAAGWYSISRTTRGCGCLTRRFICRSSRPRPGR